MKRKIRNLIGTLLLVLAVAATQIPVTDVQATQSSASDFQMDGSKLVKYTGTAITVSVPDIVTEIGNEAFLDDADLYTVYLPKNLKKIGNSAFSGCTMLTVIDFPETLKEIGNFAFNGCTSLSKVELGKNVAKMGHGTFAGCTSLDQIDFHKDNQSFSCDVGVLYDKKKTKIYQALAGSIFNKYNMPSTVKEIEPYAFWGCKDLRFIAFSSFVKTIPSYAFSNSGLESFTLPYSVTTIDSKAFSDCVNLQKAEIPPSVNYIHPTAFDGCPELQIEAEETSAAATFDAGRDRSQAAASEYEDTAGIPSDVQRQGQDVLESTGVGQNGNSAGGIMAAAGSIGETAVVGGRAVVFLDNRKAQVHGTAAVTAKTEAPQPESAPATDLDAKTSAEETQTTREGIPTESVSGNEALTGENTKKGGQFPKYTIVDHKIAGQAYYKDTNLTSYAIPQDITSIGNFAFGRSGLAQIIIPESVTTIGYGAFYHCDSLEKVTIPSSVTEIEPYAFEKTKWLENWKNGGSTNNYLIVGDGILIAYKGKESKITVPEGVKKIAAEVFKNHKGITEAALPNSLQVIGEDAFIGCNNLKTVTGGVNVEKISDRAFSGCPIETIRIHAKVTEVGMRSFDGGENAVIFLGKELPKVSSDETAQRLSRRNYRDLAFKKAKVAVVDSSIQEFANTILDPNMYGFKGLICYIEKEAAPGENGSLKIVSNTSESSNLPEQVMIYGKEYSFSNAAEVPAADSASANAGGKTVSVKVNSQVIPSQELISASLPGHTESYILSIQDSTQAAEDILKGYRILYGANAEQEIAGFDICLYDGTGTAPITKLGSETMTVTLPLPSGISTRNLHVVCTDRDGQLEEVSTRLIEINKIPCAEFQVKHFSSFGIYSYGEGGSGSYADQGGVLTALSRRKDASPDTGDPIHPKWFLAVGLFSLAMMTFFMKSNSITKNPDRI